ncbi:hypothetical protein SCLCIDRAFT_285658 [Scleroderma citrinum Foug A]|uniref:Uncharacterized protein n=1 Tax=Scleroderma citrinum Foug A TaxID=1036808 RepID=A0A0C3DHC4_9AGAM|nr:hypothetical protein SCLCIDRAFT_285658 [Scleroderma citrinum Foug A]
MSNSQQHMSSFSSGRGTSGATSYPHPGSTHGGMGQDNSHRSYTLSGAYGNPSADFRPHSSSSNLDPSMAYPGRSGQLPWGSGQRGMGGHQFLHDPPGMIPRPQSAVAQSHHVRSNSLAHTSSRGYPGQAGPSSRPLPLSPEFGSSVAHYSQDVTMAERPQSSGHSTRSAEQLEQEMNALQEKVKHLELVNHHAQMRVKELERELSKQIPPPGPSGPSLGYPLTTPQPPAVQSSWKARTDARTRLFCSLNRAGNALCAWHDSRRERRAYPPRMAPPGYLNCGCTFDEALFEESLSRHGVGSYHPGENVRMDPALRNPLLRLLERRYGYRDGDFERDPTTGEWVAGEGSLMWEQKLSQGSLSVRKRADDRR